MKKQILIISGIFLFLIGSYSCSNTIEDYYTDPDATTTADLGQLFTYMCYNSYIRPTYWDYATFVTGVTGKYSQFIGIEKASKMYEPSTDYNEDRWEGYYTGGIMNQYREIQKNYEALSSDEQADQYIYMQIAKVILYDQTAQMVDYWGDIPFTEAGGLNYTNTLTNAKFDDAETIYTLLIDSLASLNTYFANASLSTTIKTSLSTQDILLGGDLDLWQKYTNSLRLRLLMRISNYDETTAKTKITAMLNDPDTYPVIDKNSEDILLEMNPTNLISDIQSGLTDGATSNGAIAPYYMLNTEMVANNDPRTAVFWDPGSNADDEYLGLKSDTTASAAENQWSKGYLATYDSATFIMNYNVPGVLFTAAEVSFLKAEAYERWDLGTAQDEYETGIKQSIDFYYSLNQDAYAKSSFSRTSLTTPTDATIESYLEESAIAYSGTTDEKLEKIYTQKWINFFILQAGQAWSEVRRTGYPELPFAEDPSSDELPPVRLLYPDTEKSYNSDNYSAVSSKDTRDTNIFWDVN